MTYRFHVAGLAVLTGCLAAVAPATASAAPRPHSRVVTYDRGALIVERLQITTRQTYGRLRTRVDLTVSNERSTPLRRELAVGRCVHGVPAYPTCPQAARVLIRLGARERRAVTLTATLAMPPARLDAIEATLARPGSGSPFAFRDDAQLLVTGNAWRGPGAGRRYGMAIAPGDAARRLSFDIPLFSADEAYVDLIWTGTAAPTGAATRIARCRGALCPPSALPPSGSRSGPQRFGRRFNLRRGTATSIAIAVAGTGGQPALTAELPWPAR